MNEFLMVSKNSFINSELYCLLTFLGNVKNLANSFIQLWLVLSLFERSAHVVDLVLNIAYSLI